MKALKEEGVRSVLVNPNIATIQTSERFADRVHFVPVTPRFVADVIEEERPDAILLGFGGQTALNCGIELAESGALDRYGVRVLGTPVRGIRVTEDRGMFKQAMTEAGLSVPRSRQAYSPEEAALFASEAGFPVMVRVAYTLGGKGGGVARDRGQLKEVVERGLNSSIAHQVLVEEYLGGWKQIEYEVMRDASDNSIVVCNMENMLGMRVHTGDNIVVAPSQSITNREYHLLRSASMAAARKCEIVGECNVQFALDPASERFHVIEINARMSRSSALASKATGYPLAYVATKVALGYDLTELKNKVTGVTTALFEPSLDYVVVKMPVWDTLKFDGVSRGIGTSMKSIGEAMSIGRTFEEAIQKAVRMQAQPPDWTVRVAQEERAERVLDRLKNPTDTVLFDVLHALCLGVDAPEVARLAEIDPWFIGKLKKVTEVRGRLAGGRATAELLLEAKRAGFSDRQIAYLCGLDEDGVRSARRRAGVSSVTKVIDTLAAEWPARTNYLYETYNAASAEARPTDRRKVMILGAGPYRIGSSVEFDWCTMMMAWSMKKLGVEEVVVVNCNPETVSTDFDMNDRLYFEELTLERVLDIYEKERPLGIVLSVGGQTPNNLAVKLRDRGVNVLGTSAASIEMAEDRKRFSTLLDGLGIPQPPWRTCEDESAAREFGRAVGYPVVLRPSYVLSGSAMRVVWNEGELSGFVKRAVLLNPEHPVTVSRFFVDAKEAEVDAVSDGERTVIGAVVEHVQRGGVHSGDSIMSIPALSVPAPAEAKMRSYARALAAALRIVGPFNVQYLVRGEDVMVIECNLRASRSMPYVSKATGVNLIDLCCPAILGEGLKASEDVPPPRGFMVKVPQFSFMQMHGAEPKTGVEMRSTGEVACSGASFVEAMSKALVAAGQRIPSAQDLVVALPYPEWEARWAVPALEKFREAGMDLVSPVPVEGAGRVVPEKDVLEAIVQRKVSLVLSFNNNVNDTPEVVKAVARRAVEFQVHVVTTPEEAEAVLMAAELQKRLSTLPRRFSDSRP
ncbi:MAG: carbamoyl-phosphate synthase (glutamine-hydrolyzing) large subunit [Nitrososphaerota archaeon]|nr:carbamoyl-phosphate synthase (glutamine-hydrolyzing) large subunit [Nitrososphaerota archaeon]